MSTVRRVRALPVVGLAVALLVAACQPAQQTSSPEESEPAPTDVSTGAITSVDDVQQAVIQIVAEGAFVDPEFGAYEGAGRGSGFIIDPSGIAVTNNHVVTGSALLNVYVGGDSEPVNATVLGVSECSDLAVIDLAGDGYRYLEWYDGEITTGLEVYAAGFPLGDPEFTLTRGIVSKTDYDIETGWASVENVIEHDARIRGGNSGGPLVTNEAQVVGVNYAGSDVTDQNLAINVAEARAIVEQLAAGEDVHSIGINGQAVQTEDGTTGLWVASVESGSPAATEGIQPGDLVTRVEGLSVAIAGTMEDYCDILRSHTGGDPLAVTIARLGLGEIWAGTLNEGGPMERVSAPMPSDGPPSDGAGGYAFNEETDDTGAISVVIPDEWSDRYTAGWTYGDAPVGVAVIAAPDLEAWFAGWDQPGLFFGASADLAQSHTTESLLDENTFNNDCESLGRFEYDDGFYTGFYDEYANCGGIGTAFYVIAAEPADGSALLFLQISLIDAADDEALTNIIQSFQVVGTLP